MARHHSKGHLNEQGLSVIPHKQCIQTEILTNITDMMVVRAKSLVYASRAEIQEQRGNAQKRIHDIIALRSQGI